MEILGWFGYAALVYLAIAWAIAVRSKLGAGIPVIITSLFFLLAALFIPIGGISFIHSLWVIPLGYLICFAVSYSMPKSRFLTKFLIFFGSAYAGIIRIGVDQDKIRQAQIKEAKAAVESWAQKRESKQ